MEATELLSNPEVEVAASEGLQRQLGRRGLDGLTLAAPVEWHPNIEIEENLKAALVGQGDAIEAIMNALNREKFRNPNRPIANLLFLGPTGVGKTETAKELAYQLHGDDSAFVKVDCSSFSHGHEITSLVGAPPSYVGREQKPVFAPEIIEQNKAVVVFDEVEKGSQPLWDLMLQIMDDGEVLLNTTGQKVSFKNAIVILTTNLGSNEISDLLNPKQTGFQPTKEVAGTTSRQQVSAAATAALRNYFRPEFINRIDSKIVFDSLTDDQLGEVLDRYASQANERYQDEARIMLKMSDDLQRELVVNNEERHLFGARPILRDYDRIVESSLAKHVNSGSIPAGSSVYAVLADEQGKSYADKIQFYYEMNPDLALPEVPEVVQAQSLQGTEIVRIPFVSQELDKIPHDDDSPS
jgi:ATP-dependent Clp protease ATP-binding subunit ClpA